MTRLSALSCAMFLVLAGLAAADAVSFDQLVVRDGISRRYRIHLPPDPGVLRPSELAVGRGFRSVPPWMARQRPVPLMVLFHETGMGFREMERMSGIITMADQRNYAVLEALATGTWNDGRKCRRVWSQRRGVDDVSFVLALVKKMIHDYPVDEKRVYAVGYGAGASFCHYMAVNTDGVFNSIACVAGGMAVGTAPGPDLKRPPSVLVIHGTRDPVFPYGGGLVRRGRLRLGSILPQVGAISLWRWAAGCGSNGYVEYRIPFKVRTITWPAGSRGAVVSLYTVTGGGHEWPSETTKWIFDFFEYVHLKHGPGSPPPR